MNPLNSIPGTLVAGLMLSVTIAFATRGDHLIAVPANAAVIWAHVFAGIDWIGLLYYFNFVQVPALSVAAADESGQGGAGIKRYVAPRGLTRFRWGAVFTRATPDSLQMHSRSVRSPKLSTHT